MRRAALTALFMLGGCYGTTERDVGPVDAPRGPCDPIGSLVVCGEECGGRMNCREPPGTAYNCAMGLCFRQWEPPPPPLSDNALLFCAVPNSSSSRREFPYRGDLACAADVLGGNLGYGISEPDCDALEGARGVACVWSDGTTRTRTPPSMHDTCPALPTPDAPAGILCGGACGHCTSQVVGEFGSFYTPCVGRNDERELGVCGLEIEMASGCSPENPPSRTCGFVGEGGLMTMDWGTDRCACLSFLREDGFERAGWNVPDTNCLAYRALYPGQVECYDDEWNPLP